MKSYKKLTLVTLFVISAFLFNTQQAEAQAIKITFSCGITLNYDCSCSMTTLMRNVAILDELICED